MRPLPTVVLCSLLLGGAFAQQPNSPSAALLVQLRQGPPYPIVATSPADGSISVAVVGPAGAPFVLATGPLNPGAHTFASGLTWDLGTAPGFSDVSIIADGTQPGASAFTIAPGGTSLFSVPIPTGLAIQLPPVQALVSDPASPIGFRFTAASAITIVPSKNVLFLQGDYDPGLGGLGPHCRIYDPSPVGFSQLRVFLDVAGFGQVHEVVDTSVVVTPQLLAAYGLLVLGSNQRALAVSEVDAIENFVRAGGGLLTYSDFMFGPGSVPSDNQVLSRFGLLTTYDNFGGTQVAGSFQPHPISAGVNLGVVGEGVSIIEIVGNGVDAVTNVASCASNGGACLPYPAVAPSGSPNPTYSVCAAVAAGAGRVVATFDRNTFFNFPGLGTNILEASNLTYAVNVFLWAAGY